MSPRLTHLLTQTFTQLIKCWMLPLATLFSYFIFLFICFLFSFFFSYLFLTRCLNLTHAWLTHSPVHSTTACHFYILSFYSLSLLICFFLVRIPSTLTLPLLINALPYSFHLTFTSICLCFTHFFFYFVSPFFLISLPYSRSPLPYLLTHTPTHSLIHSTVDLFTFIFCRFINFFL